MKHTKGPWVVRYDGILPYIDEDRAGPGAIAELTDISVTKHRSKEENNANAKLIAKAPDMFKILQDIDKYWGVDGKECEFQATLDKAVSLLEQLNEGD